MFFCLLSPKYQNFDAHGFRFYGRDAEQWSYDAHYNRSMNSHVGAVINKALRLFTILPVIPKYIPPTGPKVSITFNGEVHLLPQDMIAFVNTSATHHHSKY
jgi:hypothetical protein